MWKKDYRPSQQVTIQNPSLTRRQKKIVRGIMLLKLGQVLIFIPIGGEQRAAFFGLLVFTNATWNRLSPRFSYLTCGILELWFYHFLLCVENQTKNQRFQLSPVYHVHLVFVKLKTVHTEPPNRTSPWLFCSLPS